MKIKDILILMGGWSSEREVSLKSGTRVANALEGLGHGVRCLDIQKDLNDLIDHLTTPRPDVVFNALHGIWGEDGSLQSILDTLDIPYTHSGVRPSACAMHKPTSKAIFSYHGLPVAPHIQMDWKNLKPGLMKYPYIIKPICDGSSVDIYPILSAQDEKNFFEKPISFKQPVMIEEYIYGKELTCGVMGSKALMPIEIPSMEDQLYNYDKKYSSQASQHILPPHIPDHLITKIQHMALKAHEALGCKGITRTDFRYDAKNDRLIALEINTQPGMTATSLFPDAAQYEGINYAQLAQWIAKDGLCTH